MNWVASRSEAGEGRQDAWARRVREDEPGYLNRSSAVAASAAAGGHASLVETFGDHFTLIDPASADWETAVAAVRESITLKI